MTGVVKQGNFVQPLQYTSVAKGWNLVSNPYPSNIDWTTVAPINVNNAIYSYRPSLSGGSYGSYINGSSANGGSQYVEAYSSFFVRANAPNPSLEWHESDKVADNPINSVFRNTAIHNRLSLVLVNNSTQYTDEVVVRFGDDNATDRFDTKYDAENLAGTAHDLYVLDDEKTKYSIYHGSALSNNQIEKRTISLGIANATTGSYTIHANILNEITNGNTVWLRDAYTNTLTEIAANSSYLFQITADTATQGNARFSLVFNRKVLPTINELSIKLSPNPAKGTVKLSYSQAEALNTTVVINNLEGKQVLQVNLGKTQQGIKDIDLSKLLSGTYFIQFNNGISIKTEKLILE
jgi:hypothetical protein